MWFPSLEAEFPVNEQELRLTDAADPLPANEVLIEMAPPFPEFVIEFPENEQSEIVSVAPLPTLMAPPYFGPEPNSTTLSLIQVPDIIKLAPAMKMAAPPDAERFSLSAMMQSVTVTVVVLSPLMYKPDPP